MEKVRPRAISIRAERDYVRAFNDMAEDMQTTTADLVKNALDEKYGDQIGYYLSLRADRAHKSGHKDTFKGTHEPG